MLYGSIKSILDVLYTKMSPIGPDINPFADDILQEECTQELPESVRNCVVGETSIELANFKQELQPPLPQKADHSQEMSPEKMKKNIINKVLHFYITELSEKREINFSPAKIRKDIIILLRESNLGKFTTQEKEYFIQNFLEPEMEGTLFIDETIKFFLNPKETENMLEMQRKAIRKIDFDFMFNTLKKLVWTVIDAATNTQWKENLTPFIQKIENFSSTQKLFESFPDLRTIIVEILPQIAKNTNKQEFLKDLDTLWKKLEVLYVDDTPNIELFHDCFQLIKNILPQNPQDISTLEKHISWLEIVKNNAIASSILDLLKIPSISPKLKKKLLQDTLNICIIATKKSINEDELNQGIETVTSTIIHIVESIPKNQQSIVKIALKNIINTLPETIKEKTLQELWEKKQTSMTEKVRFLWDNMDFIRNNMDKAHLLTFFVKNRETKVKDIAQSIAQDISILADALKLVRDEFKDTLKTQIMDSVTNLRNNMITKLKGNIQNIWDFKGIGKIENKVLQNLIQITHTKLESGTSLNIWEISESIESSLLRNQELLTPALKELGIEGRIPKDFMDEIIHRLLQSWIVKIAATHCIKKFKNTSDITNTPHDIMSSALKEALNSQEGTKKIIESFTYALHQKAKEWKFEKPIQHIIKAHNLPLKDFKFMWENFWEDLETILQHSSPEKIAKIFVLHQENLYKLIYSETITSGQSQEILTKIGIDIIASMENIPAKNKKLVLLAATGRVIHKRKAHDTITRLVNNYQQANKVPETKDLQELFKICNNIAFKAPWYIASQMDRASWNNSQNEGFTSIFTKNNFVGLFSASLQTWTLNTGDIIETYFKTPENMNDFVITIKEYFQKRIHKKQKNIW